MLLGTKKLCPVPPAERSLLTLSFAFSTSSDGGHLKTMSPTERPFKAIDVALQFKTSQWGQTSCSSMNLADQACGHTKTFAVNVVSGVHALPFLSL